MRSHQGWTWDLSSVRNHLSDVIPKAPLLQACAEWSQMWVVVQNFSFPSFEAELLPNLQEQKGRSKCAAYLTGQEECCDTGVEMPRCSKLIDGWIWSNNHSTDTMKQTTFERRLFSIQKTRPQAENSIFPNVSTFVLNHCLFKECFLSPYLSESFQAIFQKDVVGSESGGTTVATAGAATRDGSDMGSFCGDHWKRSKDERRERTWEMYAASIGAFPRWGKFAKWEEHFMLWVVFCRDKWFQTLGFDDHLMARTKGKVDQRGANEVGMLEDSGAATSASGAGTTRTWDSWQGPGLLGFQFWGALKVW